MVMWPANPTSGQSFSGLRTGDRGLLQQTGVGWHSGLPGPRAAAVFPNCDRCAVCDWEYLGGASD